MKKNIIRIVLDVCMFLLLILMYKKNVINMEFHELGGIAVCVIGIVHAAINWRWIVGVTKRLFSKQTPVKTKISWVLNLLLLVSFVGILVTGIGMSKTVLTSISYGGMTGKTLHYFFSALSIIIVGIHVGLHWGWIKNNIFGFISKRIKYTKPVKIILYAVFVVLMACGGFAFTKSNTIGFLSRPFVTMSAPVGGIEFGEGNHQFENTNGNFEGRGGKIEGQGKGQGRGQGKGSGDFHNGEKGHGQGNSFSATNFFSCLGIYFLTITFIAGITAFIEGLILKIKKRSSVEE